MKIDKMKIDVAMANKGYSAKELSEKCGVSQITIARLKRGVQKARPETIGKLAKALSVPVESLIDMKGGD
ncbi:helix-turn-helix transcriptional regulator [Lachnospiraceae bacterium MD335]|nr:helix-turn-helix transcriptional regulator [Lachnospiraceae bacterium MD335]